MTKVNRGSSGRGKKKWSVVDPFKQIFMRQRACVI